MNGRLNPEYKTLLMQGPFPNSIDPWAEVGRYFHQIHSGMIGHLQEQMRDTLLDMGYVAACEISLQITERREPDIHIRYKTPGVPEPIKTWNYSVAAERVLAEPGISTASEAPDFDALFIKEAGRLVTVIEIISPSNKVDLLEIERYKTHRDKLRAEGVNFVEIDLTRSVKRIVYLEHDIMPPYHVAIYLPWQSSPLMIEIGWADRLKRIAIPLREDVVPVELQDAYTNAYEVSTIAVQMNDEGHYQEDNLPFPSLLTDEQRQDALAAVEAWKKRLAELE